jgi:hypothetical protein
MSQSRQIAAALVKNDILEPIEQTKADIVIEEMHEKNVNITQQARSLSFKQWMFHEPIAIIILSTLVSLAIQRASARIESFAISPIVECTSNWFNDDAKTNVSCNQVNNPSPAHSVSVAAAKTPVWQAQIVALVVDLLLNLIVIYLIYLLLVRGGLRPNYGVR